jgi:hypothetical protein
MDNYGNKFKKGDRVLLRSNSKWWSKDNTDVANPQNIEGTVDMNEEYVGVRWDNGEHNGYSSKDLDLVSPSYQIY